MHVAVGPRIVRRLSGLAKYLAPQTRTPESPALLTVQPVEGAATPARISTPLHRVAALALASVGRIARLLEESRNLGVQPKRHAALAGDGVV